MASYVWHPVCSSRVTSRDQEVHFPVNRCFCLYRYKMQKKERKKEIQECLKSEINKYISPLHSSRFPLAVCGLPELSCWPVSRGGRISHRSIWPAHPKASMFRRLLRRCCCHRCSRAPTKVSSCHTRQTDIKAGSAGRSNGAPRPLTPSSKSRSDVHRVLFSSARRLQLIKNNGPPDDDDVC